MKRSRLTPQLLAKLRYIIKPIIENTGRMINYAN